MRRHLSATDPTLPEGGVEPALPVGMAVAARPVNIAGAIRPEGLIKPTLPDQGVAVSARRTSAESPPEGRQSATPPEREDARADRSRGAFAEPKHRATDPWPKRVASGEPAACTSRASPSAPKRPEGRTGQTVADHSGNRCRARTVRMEPPEGEPWRPTEVGCRSALPLRDRFRASLETSARIANLDESKSSKRWTLS
jgi:hypothetical protein